MSSDIPTRVADYFDAIIGPFEIGDEVDRLLARLRIDAPNEFDAWLLERARVWLSVYANDRNMKLRAASLARPPRRASIVDEDELNERRSRMETVSYVVTADDIRKKLGEMTGADHRHVANQYQADGDRLHTLAAFHRVVAKRVGKRRTADVFTDAEYQQLYERFAGTDEQAAA